MNYNYSQLVGIAESGGFPPRYAGIAASIALAESSGNPSAEHHNTNGSTDYGLWQINSVHAGSYGQPNSWLNPQTNAKVAYSLFKSQGFRPWVTYNSGAYKRYLPTGSQVAGATGNRAMVTSPVHAQTAPADTNVATAQNASLIGDAGNGVKGLLGITNDLLQVPGEKLFGLPPTDKNNPTSPISGNGWLANLFGLNFLAIFSSAFWIRVGLGAAGVAIIIVAIAFMLESNKNIRTATEVAAL